MIRREGFLQPVELVATGDGVHRAIDVVEFDVQEVFLLGVVFLVGGDELGMDVDAIRHASPHAEAEAEAAATTIEVDGAKSRMVVLDGGEGKQSTAAVIVPKGQRMWFVKMKGDTEIVLKQVEAFKRFASSLTF